MCTERKATGLFVLADFLCDNELVSVLFKTSSASLKNTRYLDTSSAHQSLAAWMTAASLPSLCSLIFCREL